MSKELIKVEGTTNKKQRNTVAILWGILIVSFLLDSFHCNILALIYNCRVEELIHVSDFYILSPIFGLLDLTVGIMLLKKLKVIESINCCIELYDENQLTIPVKVQMLQILIAIFVVIISVCSLLTDVWKFFA